MSNCNRVGMKLAGAQVESFCLVNCQVMLVVFQIPGYQLYVHFPCRYSMFALIDSAREGHMSPRSPPQLSHWRFTTALITVTAWSTNERAPHETLSIYETLRLIKTIPTLKENKMLWKYIKRNHIWKGIAKMTHQYVKYSSSSLICTI